MRTTLEGQGVLLGLHHSYLDTVHRSLEAMDTSNSDMAAQLQLLALDLQLSYTARFSQQSVSPDAKDDLVQIPRLPTPEPFVSQCSLIFQLPTSIVSNHLLTGGIHHHPPGWQSKRMGNGFVESWFFNLP